MRTNIILTSREGEFTLHKHRVTKSTMNGQVTGVAVWTELQTSEKPPLEALVFRTFIKVDERFAQWMHFPCRLSFPNGGWSQALLPLNVDGTTIDIYFIKEGPYMVLETPLEANDEEANEKARKLLGATRFFLTYLTGMRLDGDGCDAIITVDTNTLVSSRWYEGRNRKRTVFHPIPSSWTEWSCAQKELEQPWGVGPAATLCPDMVSTCLTKFIANPGLVTCTEYLIHFPQAVSEMRGAILSVALESLTNHLQKSGILDDIKLLPDEGWLSLRSQLRVVAESASIDEAATRVLLSRIDGLNRATNSQKLKLPFEKLAVPIRPEEKKAIERRNKLLHTGRLLSPRRTQDPEAWQEAYKVEMCMYTAINKLLLKYLGYSGPMIDWGLTSMVSGEQSYFIL